MRRLDAPSAYSQSLYFYLECESSQFSAATPVFVVVMTAPVCSQRLANDFEID
jgi:hypothetical protein